MRPTESETHIPLTFAEASNLSVRGRECRLQFFLCAAVLCELPLLLLERGTIGGATLFLGFYILQGETLIGELLESQLERARVDELALRAENPSAASVPGCDVTSPSRCSTS